MPAAPLAPPPPAPQQPGMQPMEAGDAAAGMALAATLPAAGQVQGQTPSAGPGRTPAAGAASTAAGSEAGLPDPSGAAEAAARDTAPAAPPREAASARSDTTATPAMADARPEPAMPDILAEARPDAMPPVPAAGPHQALAAAPPMEAPPAAARPYAHAAVMPAQQVAPVIVAQVAKGGDASRLIVQLRPAELGGLEVAVEASRDGGTQVRILVERPETLMLLARDRGAIEQALQAAGIETRPDTLSMSLGEPGQRGSGQGQRGAEGGADRGRGQAQPWGTPGPRGTDTISIAPTRLIARGLLDVAL